MMAQREAVTGGEGCDQTRQFGNMHRPVVSGDRKLWPVRGNRLAGAEKSLGFGAFDVEFDHGRPGVQNAVERRGINRYTRLSAQVVVPNASAKRAQTGKKRQPADL